MICIDSSVVVKLVVNEVDSEVALALFHAKVVANEDIIAPELLLMEVSNVMLKKTRRPPALSRNAAIAALSDALDLDIILYGPESLHRNAFRIAASFQLPAVYDAYYLALAADAQCPLWTADQRLIRSLNGRLPYVHSLGDFRG